MVLRKLKRLLGLDSSSSSKRGAGRDVTVRDDRADETPADDDSEPDVTRDDVDDTTPERRPDAEGAESDDEAGLAESERTEDGDEPIASDTDADASTDSLTDEEAATETPSAATEPSEAAGPGSEDVTTDIDEAEPGVEEADPGVDEAEPDIDEAELDEVDPDADEADPDEGETAADTPVDEVKGIGPAYSDRLGEVGIHSAEELADADAEEIADRISVPEKTVRKWIDRADER